MANIIRKSETQGQQNVPTPVEWEPFRAMRDLLRWDPFRELAPFRAPETAFSPDFEVKETKDAYVFKADVPGVKDSDLDITLTKNRLTVQGKREAEQEEKQDTYYAYERSYGSFTRSFTLPEGVDADHLRADLTNGVLTIVLPKVAEAKPRKITVGGTAGGTSIKPKA